MQEDFIGEEIKTMFKVTSKLQNAFSDVKVLTYRYLLKAKKIKEAKLQARKNRRERERMHEIEQRKQDRVNLRREKRQKEKSEKQRVVTQRGPETVNCQHIDQNARPVVAPSKKTKDQPVLAPVKNKPSQVHPPVFSKPTPVYQAGPPVPQKMEAEKKLEKPQTERQKRQKRKGGTTVEPADEEKVLKKPIEPQSPYFRFLRDKKSEIKASAPNMTMEQISRIMRNIWDKLTDSERRPYVTGYEKAKAEYEREMYEYYQKRATGPKKRDKQAKKREEVKEKESYDFIDEFGDI